MTLLVSAILLVSSITYAANEKDVCQSVMLNETEAVSEYLSHANSAQLINRECQGKSLLSWAFINKNAEMVFELMKAGARPMKHPQDHEHPVCLAIRMGHYRLIREVVSAGEVDFHDPGSCRDRRGSFSVFDFAHSLPSKDVQHVIKELAARAAERDTILLIPHFLDADHYVFELKDINPDAVKFQTFHRAERAEAKEWIRSYMATDKSQGGRKNILLITSGASWGADTAQTIAEWFYDEFQKKALSVLTVDGVSLDSLVPMPFGKVVHNVEHQTNVYREGGSNIWEGDPFRGGRIDSEDVENFPLAGLAHFRALIKIREYLYREIEERLRDHAYRTDYFISGTDDSGYRK